MRYISKHRILHRPFRMKIQRFKSTCPGIKWWLLLSCHFFFYLSWCLF